VNSQPKRIHAFNSLTTIPTQRAAICESVSRTYIENVILSASACGVQSPIFYKRQSLLILTHIWTGWDQTQPYYAAQSYVKRFKLNRGCSNVS
jgi:hypothetical protein